MPDHTQQDDDVALWQTQSTDGFRMSTEEILGMINMMNRRSRRSSILSYLVCVLFACLGGLMIAGSSPPRVGGVVIIIGISYVAWQIRQNRFREIPPEDAGNTASLHHLLTELARQRDFHWGPRFGWRLVFFVPVVSVFFAGFSKIIQIVCEIILFIAIAFVTVPLNLKTARLYQKQIDALARLQEEP